MPLMGYPGGGLMVEGKERGIELATNAIPHYLRSTYELPATVMSSRG